MKSAINKSVIFLLLLTLAFAGVFGIAVMTGIDVAYAADTVYGGRTARELWYYGESYLNLNGLKAEVSEWDLTKASKTTPVVIAVIDTGVNTTHSLFTTTNTILRKSDNSIIGYNSYFAATSANPTATQLNNIADVTDNSHGTAVAGIMAMLIYELGLSDYIKLLPVKASNSATPPSNYTSDQRADYYRSFSYASVLKALEYVVSTQDTIGVDVVNLSLTGYDEKDWNSQAMQKAVSDASDYATVIAAAGNGDKTVTTGYSTDVKKGYPALTPGVLSVMGYKAGASKTTASNYGDYDIIAPGDSIYTAKGSASEYQFIGGTSMACAFVSVTAALLRLKNNIDVATDSATSAVPATKIANHIRTSAKSVITHIDGDKVYNLPKHSILESLTAAYDESYVEPRDIAVTDEGVFTDGAVSMIADNAITIRLTANLVPYGATDPANDELIKWYLVHIDQRPLVDENGEELEGTEEYEISKVQIGAGKHLEYTPSIAGTYAIRAEYISGENVYDEDRRFTYYYQSYSAIANSVKVILSDEFNIENQRNTATVFSNDSVSLSLSCQPYIDPEVETKWYVNGEYVYSGAIFDFTPKKAGEYEISAQYGDFQRVGKTFVVNAKTSVGRPESILSIGITGATLLIAACVFITHTARRKKCLEEAVLDVDNESSNE